MSRARTKAQLLENIERRITKLADEVFNEEEAIDSDGADQAEREGLMQGLAIVQDEFRCSRL